MNMKIRIPHPIGKIRRESRNDKNKGHAIHESLLLIHAFSIVFLRNTYSDERRNGKYRGNRIPTCVEMLFTEEIGFRRS
jgi:hypothetical protein